MSVSKLSGAGAQRNIGKCDADPCKLGRHPDMRDWVVGLVLWIGQGRSRRLPSEAKYRSSRTEVPPLDICTAFLVIRGFIV